MKTIRLAAAVSLLICLAACGPQPMDGTKNAAKAAGPNLALNVSGRVTGGGA